ncbi:MAG TPA: ATP-binding protein, partial [Bacillota bacterium]|nr:ATP-binding protein [Bacillota bacterium]
NLVPWNFGAGSLVEALKSLAAQNKKMFAVACDFKARGEIPPFPPEKEMHLYKIAQEAVSNGIKHGKASQVRLRLIRSPKELVLRVQNDGLPFPAIDKLKAGAGLRIMNYRANVIGGKFEIHTSPQDGTEVVCTLPLDEPARPNQPRPQAGA